jgi:hypothetical protein
VGGSFIGTRSILHLRMDDFYIYVGLELAMQLKIFFFHFLPTLLDWRGDLRHRISTICYQPQRSVNTVDSLWLLGLNWAFSPLFWEGFVVAIGKPMGDVWYKARPFSFWFYTKMRRVMTSIGGVIPLFSFGDRTRFVFPSFPNLFSLAIPCVDVPTLPLFSPHFQIPL